jgi:CheY-like chemotaxis protein
MPIRVLAFESDTEFARELQSEFRSLGCEVMVVDDVNSGLQDASANRPDLILLTIELPRMSGYSVCNRIKRDADLKDIPLIIMSSESTDQTFEQHRRLGTRAQDYIRKPVTFSALLERVRQFVDLKPVSLIPDDDGIVIDDEIELSEQARISRVPASLRPIDADIDDFAEHAFGAMIDQSPATESPSAPSVPSVIPSSPRLPTDVLVESRPASVVSLDQERRDADLVRVKSQLEEKERLLSEALSEVRELKRASRVAQNETSETEDLKRELRDLKMKLNTPSAAPKQSMGPTAREFLDLREQFNKKDKELLDLRDLITRKDKELLSTRDTSLAHERDKADLSDKLDEITRQFADLQKISDAARNDKEAAAKRADDFKRKSEKFVGLLEEKTAELDRAATQHSVALEAAHAESARILAEATKEAQAALERAVADARASAEEHERQSLETVREAEIEQRNAAMSELEQRLRSEHAADKSQALSELEHTLQTAHANDKANALGQLQSQKEQSDREAESRIQGLEKELASSNGELATSRQETQQRDESIANLEASLNASQRELEQANHLLGIREQSLANLQSELAQQKVETSEALDQLSAERRRLKAAVDKWIEDRGNLERVKDALAAALVQVEGIEARTLD